MSQRIVNSGAFPRPHLVLIGVLTLLMLGFALEQLTDDDSHRFTTDSVLVDLPPVQPPRDQPLLSTQAMLPLPGSSPVDAAAEIAAVAASITPPKPTANPPLTGSVATSTLLSITDPSTLQPEPTPLSRVPHKTNSIQVSRGDNLSVIFKRQGIPARELQRLLASEPLGSRLKDIFPGHTLTFTRTDDGTLVKLAYTPGPLETLEFERFGGGFMGRELHQDPARSNAYRQGVIDHSLFIASQRAGLPDQLTMRLAQIFQWDVDFVLDIRKGDQFHVVFEELYVGDEFVGYGSILAAEFVNQGESYRAIRYEDSHGHADYYNPEGESMRKAFLRAPVEFSRISSNFNLRRVHPLFKRNMPHRGIDYAAPTGTPILAAGDGRVVTASRTNPNGNFVVIQHGEQFTTKYLHLSKFGRGIKRGTRVKQGQTIGYVGATGWASGPHLHYEFLVNGVHQNPRTVELPDAQPISLAERSRFDQRAVPLLSLLDSFKQQDQLALGN